MNYIHVLLIAFPISFLLNIFVIWYIVRLMRELLEITSSLEELYLEIQSFSKHIEKVYNLEMFYGDETLQNLLLHARALTEEFTRYDYLFSLVDNEGEPREDERAIPTQETPPQEAE